MSPDEARQIDLDSWRAGNPDGEPVSVAQVLADQAAHRSRVDASFGSAWSLLSGGFAVVPCNQSGNPLPGAEPVTDTAALMTTWDRYPGAIAAAACGQPYDLVAVAVTDADKEWLAEVAIDPATRRNPGPAKPEATSTPFGDYQEPGDPRPGAHHRELAGTAIRLVELVGPTPRMAAATSGPGDRAESWGENLASKLARPKPTTSIIYAWSWPLPEDGKTWTLPASRRVHAGVKLQPAIPADGAVVEVNGTRWRVSWGGGLGRRMPLPSWLAPELDGKLRAP
jgi:hypothetical protein